MPDMTLLVTFYSSSGIVFAADSAITIDHGRGAARVRKEEKILRARQVGVNGGWVGYFGLADVAEEPMHEWLRRTVDRWPGSRQVAALGDYLCDQLNDAVPRAHRARYPSGLHIGAFEARDGVPVPVLQYVTNIYGLDERTGAYSDFRKYSSGEHFPAHPDPQKSWAHVPTRELKTRLREFERANGPPVWFRNGQLAFSARAWHGLTWAIGDITRNLGGQGFRLPSDLRGWELLADAMVRTNGRLYALLMSRGEPTIEGPFLKRSIPWPTG
jgi:hypothetical protein